MYPNASLHEIHLMQLRNQSVINQYLEYPNPRESCPLDTLQVLHSPIAECTDPSHVSGPITLIRLLKILIKSGNDHTGHVLNNYQLRLLLSASDIIFMPLMCFKLLMTLFCQNLFVSFFIFIIFRKLHLFL